jgi:L-threonylcarbamoyladenylate synthase
MIIHAEKKKVLSSLEKKIINHSLHENQIIAFSTDTVYGFGVNGLSEKAVFNLYDLKGRDENKPLILLADSIEKVKMYTCDIEESLMNHLSEIWPGPVTIVFPFNTSSSLIFSKFPSKTLAVRIPDILFLLDLLSELSFPLVTTSANISGRPPLQNAQEIDPMFSSLNTNFRITVDGGMCQGKPSQILSYSDGIFSVLRK